jgi:hypothetical protein
VADVRLLFWTYLLGIWLGLAYFLVVAVRHT